MKTVFLYDENNVKGKIGEVMKFFTVISVQKEKFCKSTNLLSFPFRYIVQFLCVLDYLEF